MAPKKIFSTWESQFTSQDWQEYIPLNTYKVVDVNDLPEFIRNNELTTKFNKALVVASGSAAGNFYGIIGYRPDKGNTVVDEHAFTYIEDPDTEVIDGGIIHHASYLGRTSPLPQEMTDKLNRFGVTTEISMSREPSKSNGSLEDLRTEGLLNGVNANFYSGSLNTHNSN